MSKFSDKGVIINEIQSVALGTLANETVLKLSSITLKTANFRMMKTLAEAFVVGLTAGEGTGLLLGLANDKLTVAEIAEALKEDGPVDRGETPERDIVARAVFILSMLPEGEVNTASIFHNKNGGPQLEHKMPWTWIAVEGWTWFVFNNSNSAFTTGATVKLHAKHFGMWVD